MVDIKEKEKNFLLDLLVPSSDLFGTYVETVVGKFRGKSAAFRKKLFHISAQDLWGSWSVTV